MADIIQIHAKSCKYDSYMIHIWFYSNRLNIFSALPHWPGSLRYCPVAILHVLWCCKAPNQSTLDSSWLPWPNFPEMSTSGVACTSFFFLTWCNQDPEAAVSVNLISLILSNLAFETKTWGSCEPNAALHRPSVLTTLFRSSFKSECQVSLEWLPICCRLSVLEPWLIEPRGFGSQAMQICITAMLPWLAVIVCRRSAQDCNLYFFEPENMVHVHLLRRLGSVWTNQIFLIYKTCLIFSHSVENVLWCFRISRIVLQILCLETQADLGLEMSRWPLWQAARR